LPAFSFLRDWAHSVTELRKWMVAVVFDVMTDSYRGDLKSQKAVKKDEARYHGSPKQKR